MNLVVGSTNIHFIANTSSSGSKHVAEIGENTELSFLLGGKKKKALKGKRCADVENVKQKTTEVLKGITIDKFKKLL